jgi:hypothetical protein
MCIWYKHLLPRLSLFLQQQQKAYVHMVQTPTTQAQPLLAAADKAYVHMVQTPTTQAQPPLAAADKVSSGVEKLHDKPAHMR